MSELQVTTLEANNLAAPSILAGPTTVNSSGLYLNSTSGVINSSAIFVANASGNVVLQGTMNLASITINGTTYTSLVNEAVNTQIFTANGTWTKPGWANTGNELVVVHLWGGGGGGSNNTASGRGGGGGAFVFGYFKSSQCNSICNVVVGVGGAGGTTGAAGGNSIFFANTTNALYAYGGGSGGSAGVIHSGSNGGRGGLYGGGGGGTNDVSSVSGGPGANGAVRIIWGVNRAFPNTNTGDM